MSSNKNQKEYKIGNKTIKLHNSSNHYQNNSYQNKGNTYIDRKKYYQSKIEKIQVKHRISKYMLFISIIMNYSKICYK